MKGPISMALSAIFPGLRAPVLAAIEREQFQDKLRACGADDETVTRVVAKADRLCREDWHARSPEFWYDLCFREWLESV